MTNYPRTRFKLFWKIVFLNFEKLLISISTRVIYHKKNKSFFCQTSTMVDGHQKDNANFADSDKKNGNVPALTKKWHALVQVMHGDRQKRDLGDFSTANVGVFFF